MAPEQLRDARACDERSDIYALGVILYRALSGVYPYDGATPVEVAVRVVGGNAMPLHRRVPRLPRGLSEVVMRAIAADPRQRFANVASLSSALEPYAEGPEDSLRALLNLSDHPRRRHEQLGDLASRPQSADSSSRPHLLGETDGRQASRGSGLAPPPPPPKLRPLRSPQPVSSHGSALAHRAVDARQTLVHARRSLTPTRLKLVLPPLPSPAPEPRGAARGESAAAVGFVRRAIVPALGFAIALWLGWLAMHALGADWRVGISDR
jgi:serine/threonine protein kinase